MGGLLEQDASDEELMLAFRAGDARAFDALARRHHAAIFNFIVRFVGQRERAQDVLQDTWLKVIRSASEYAAKAKFRTWVFTIARNLCVDAARKEKFRHAESLDAPRRGHEEGAAGAVLGETIADSTFDPERGAHNVTLRPLLLQALQSLPEEQREVFLLREYSGIPFKEIAVVTGVSENTVKSRMRYALEALRRRLAELGVDGDLLDEGRAAG
jgi:RNA polymerase sigma-70 factor, ECF subfamily